MRFKRRQIQPDETLFDLLSSRRRRLLLSVLHRQKEVDLTTLTRHVAALETGSTPDELDPAERKRVYISCYQTHVPRLAEAGLVEYDTDSGVVRSTAKLSAVNRYLGETTPRISTKASLVVAALLAAFYCGVLLDLAPLSSVPVPIAGVIVVVVMLVVAAARL
jgi:hypothetical protein